jgi:hypothetical protein
MIPSKLFDLEMKTELESTNNVFDYLIRERFPKIVDKKKKLNDAYSVLHKIYTKDDQDKEMKSILKIIAATRKIEPTESFLQTLKEKATDKTLFVLTLLALQPFFNVEFDFIKDTDEFGNDQKYKELGRRWKFEAPTKIEVNLDTYEMIGERDNALSVIPEETSKNPEETSKNPEETSKIEPEQAEEVSEYKLETEELQVEPEEPIVATELEDLQEFKVEPEVPIAGSEEMKVSRPAPVRVGKLQKATKTKKITKPEAPRGTSMNTVLQKTLSLKEVDPRGTSLNTTRQPDLPLNDSPVESVKPTKPKSKPKTKTPDTIEESTSESKQEKIKLKRISKPKTKPKSEKTSESKSESTEE